jgi:alkylation response protein AidB-like acyl-CoA dehydrogenase
MTFAVDAVELEAFTAEALDFLEAHAKRKGTRLEGTWGTGSDAIGVLEVHTTPEEEASDLEAARRWRRRVFDAGFGWLGGPSELGGADRNATLDDVYRFLEAEFDVPSQNIFASGTALLAPSLLVHGSTEVKARYLPGIFRGDLVACQLLSEPGAGSDLAALHTRAVGDGDSWVVSGQKVWSSYAHLAQVGQLVARTDLDAPKHDGLTMFILEMDAPGVTIRPLRQMTGEAHFNEVFLDEVRVPDANRVGEPGDGWRAILTTLMSERAAVGSGATNPATHPVDRLVQLARHLDRRAEALVRRDLADAYLHDQILRFLNLRREAAATGASPGAEGSIAKLSHSRQARRIGDFAGELLGPALTADTGEWGTFAWTTWVCGAPCLRIAGGTDEI